MKTKTCTKCKREQEITEFGRDAIKKDGIRLHCRSCIREHDKVYFSNNKESINVQHNKYKNNKYKNDRNYRLKHTLSASLRLILKRRTGKSFMFDIIGCNLDQLVRHFESLFKPGMSWGTWSRIGWQVDHVIPVSSFDLTDKEQRKACFNYKNLQPLWAHENMNKGTSIGQAL